MNTLTSNNVPTYYLDKNKTPQENATPWSLGVFKIKEGGVTRDFSIGMFIRYATDPWGNVFVEYCGAEGTNPADEHDFLALQFSPPVQLGEPQGRFTYLIVHNNDGSWTPYFGESIELNIEKMSPSPFADFPNITGTLNGEFRGPAGKKIIEATFRFTFLGIP